MSQTRVYDRNFAFAFASQVCFVLANTLLAHYARWISFLGGDERDIGWVMGVAPVISLLLRPWVGPFIDAIGVRKTWSIGQTIVIVSVPLNLLVVELGPALYLLRMITTFGLAISFASSLTYITHIAPDDRRTELIGVFGAAGFVGMIIGPALGDVLLGPSDRTYARFVAFFIVDTVMFASSTLLLWFVRPIPHHDEPARISLAAFVSTVRQYWPGTILVVNVVFGVCMTVPFVFLAKFIDEAGFQHPGIGEFFWVYAGWGLMLRVGSRALPGRAGRRKVLFLGLAAMALASFSYLWVDPAHPWRLLFPAFIGGTGHALVFHTMVSLAIDSFPADRRGTGSVLALMHVDIGQIAGGPILGQVAYWFGFHALFALVAVLCVLTMGLYAVCVLARAERSSEPSALQSRP